MKQKSRPFTSTVIPALDKSIQPRKHYLSPGFAKIASYRLAHRDNFTSKLLPPVPGGLSPVTLTCPYPPAVSEKGEKILWHKLK